jgi:hypothetical protein
VRVAGSHGGHVARAALVDALVADAHRVLGHLPEQELGARDTVSPRGYQSLSDAQRSSCQHTARPVLFTRQTAALGLPRSGTA